MITIGIVGLNEARKALKGIDEGFPNAARRSINDALKAGSTMAAKLIKARYNLKAAQIKGFFDVRKATNSNLHGVLEAKGPMLPLAEFGPSVKLQKAGKPKRSHQYVYATIIKGKRKLIKGAFQPPSGHFMERRQPERMPIFPVFTIGVPSMLRSHRILPQVEERMAEVSAKALQNHVNFYRNKGKRQ